MFWRSLPPIEILVIKLFHYTYYFKGKILTFCGENRAKAPSLSYKMTLEHQEKDGFFQCFLITNWRPVCNQ